MNHPPPRYFRILLFGELPAVDPLRFDESPDDGAPRFRFAGPDEPYLDELREEFALEAVVEGARTDYDRVRAVSRWVRTRWSHGQDSPAAGDALSILREAATGARAFRCVEYARVAAAALTSLGVPARVVGLWSREVASAEAGGSHVAAEAYLRDRESWVLVDAQFDVTPVCGETLLSAAGLRHALAEGREGIGVDSATPLRADQYLAWVAPYLHYVHAYLDNRHRGAQDPDRLMLVPLGDRVPARFQGVDPVEDMHPTHSLPAFYAPPDR